MYKISIFNNGIEQIVYYPLENAPLVLKAEVDEQINTVPQFTMGMPINVTDNINLYTTIVQVTNLKTSAITFLGRVIKKTDTMDTNGMFTREILSEGLLGILNDAYIRIYSPVQQTPTAILNNILAIMNTAQSTYNFQVGTVNFSNLVTLDFKYETCLSALFKLINILGAEVQTRKVNNIIYIDLLTQIGQNNGVAIALGSNMISITKELDTTGIATRVIPIATGDGNNILNISSINSGKDYLEDTTAESTYGIIEQTVENMDIKDVSTLKVWGQQQLNILKQIKIILCCSMADLSLLTGSTVPSLNLGDTVSLQNNVMNINQNLRVIQKQTNLFEPWNPTIQLSSQSYSLTDKIIDIARQQKILSKVTTGSITSSSVKFGDNITSTAPINSIVYIDGTIKQSTITINIDKYTYYTSDGVYYGTYPTNLIVTVNGTQVGTITGGNVGSTTIDITANVIAGNNTINITSTANGKVDAEVTMKSFVS